MTVTYTGDVATCKSFGSFFKLLFRWRGSVYKLVWADLVLFLATYFSLSVLYRFLLNEAQKRIFEKVCSYCANYGTLIPISFVLGFYVSIVVGRWWDQYKTIPWTDSIASFVSASIQGQDEKGRLMRRTIMRYCCLSQTMCFTLISPRVKKRFPTLDHLIEAGLLMENEKVIIEDLNKSCPGYSKTWLPIIWACSIVNRARKENRIRDDFAVKTLLDELNKFRSSCGLLISYDWISVPLVYTQVVTLSVYTYFLGTMLGSQYLENGNNKQEVDLVFPIFPTLQFFFYMGWLKVAESLLNPFGDDDDDFEVNWLVDRNIQVAYLVVDEMHNKYPELLRDQYWDEIFPAELPYTVASEQYRDLKGPIHSTDAIVVSKEDAEIAPSFSEHEHEYLARKSSSKLNLSRLNLSFMKNDRDRRHSIRSTSSQSTIASVKMNRAPSVTSVLKRMFSRERDAASSPNFEHGEMVDSIVNIPRSVLEEVPELDENLTTIASMRAEKKPHVNDIFPRPGQSLAIDIKDAKNRISISPTSITPTPETPTSPTTKTFHVSLAFPPTDEEPPTPDFQELSTSAPIRRDLDKTMEDLKKPRKGSLIFPKERSSRGFFSFKSFEKQKSQEKEEERNELLSVGDVSSASSPDPKDDDKDKDKTTTTDTNPSQSNLN